MKEEGRRGRERGSGEKKGGGGCGTEEVGGQLGLGKKRRSFFLFLILVFLCAGREVGSV